MIYIYIYIYIIYIYIYIIAFICTLAHVPRPKPPAEHHAAAVHHAAPKHTVAHVAASAPWSDPVRPVCKARARV